MIRRTRIGAVVIGRLVCRPCGAWSPPAVGGNTRSLEEADKEMRQEAALAGWIVEDGPEGARALCPACREGRRRAA